jgi:hypothetical protein
VDEVVGTAAALSTDGIDGEAADVGAKEIAATVLDVEVVSDWGGSGGEGGGIGGTDGAAALGGFINGGDGILVGAAATGGGAC